MLPLSSRLAALSMEHLYVVSAGLTGFFLVMLGGKPRKAQHDRILTVWLGLVLFHLLVAYRSVAHPYTPWLEVSSALVFGHGPLLYAYTLALTQPTFRPRGKWLLHLLPLLLNLALVAPALLAGRLAPLPPPARDGLAFAKLGSILAYCLLILRVRREHLQRAAHSLSALESVQLRWVQFLVYGVLAVWATGLATQVLRQMVPVPASQEDLLVNAAVSVAVTVAVKPSTRASARIGRGPFCKPIFGVITPNITGGGVWESNPPVTTQAATQRF